MKLEKMRRLIAGLLAGLFPISLSAEILRLEGRVVEEAELDRTLISKPSWLRGLHFVGQTVEDLSPPQILTVLPKAWSGRTICARITTIGGDYSASIEYDLPDDLALDQTANLAFDPKSDIAREGTPQDSGVALELGSCDPVADAPLSGENRQFIASYWNESQQPRLTPGGDVQMMLNMNVARADELLFHATLPDGVALATQCAKLDIPKALAFNYRCLISVPADEVSRPESTVLSVRYERVYRGRVSEPRFAEIIIGAGE